MRIAVIVEAWEPMWGGGQAHVLALSKALIAQYGCHIDLFVMNVARKDGRTYGPVQTLEDGHLTILRVGKTRPFTLAQRLRWIPEVIAAVQQRHKIAPYTLIHAHATVPGITGKLLSALLRRPVVYTVHGTNFLDIGTKNIFYFMERFLFTFLKYDAQISVSQKILDYKNRNRPIIIPNGVSLATFSCDTLPIQPNRKTFTILFVGRLEEIKGLPVFIEALYLLRKQCPAQRLSVHIVGTGSIETMLKEMVARYSLKDVISFDGRKNDKDLLQMYCTSSLFVLPSLSEGQPLTLLEAWAAKLPVVVTDVGDNRHMVKHGVNGYIIPPGNISALTQVLHEAITNTHLDQMGLNGYNLVRTHYSWRHIAQKTYAIYQSITR